MRSSHIPSRPPHMLPLPPHACPPSFSSLSSSLLHLLILLPLLCSLLIPTATVTAITVPSSSSSRLSVLISVSVDLSSLSIVSHSIPGNFMGLSLEWCNPLHFIGSNLSHPHSSFYNIFPFLSTREGRGPTLRIGGSSSDRSFYNPQGKPIPPWKDFVANITDDTYRALDRVSLTFNTSIIAGVSFRYAYNMTIAGPEVSAMVRLVDREAWGVRWTIEIGNEQDIYDACGSHPYEDYRPCGWGWDNFTVEYDWEMTAIEKLLPSSHPLKVFQGGAFCCPHFQSLMADWSIHRASHLSSLSFHRYIWNGCGDNPTLDAFLSDYAGQH